MFGGREVWRGIGRGAACFGVLCAAFWAVGCGAPPDDFDSEGVISGDCQAARDQRGSFMAKVKSFPLRIRADAAYGPRERSGIQQAVSRWNELGRELIGQDFFALEFKTLTRDHYVADPKDCSTGPWGGPDTLAIVREPSHERWLGFKFGPNVPAATLRCFSGGWVDHQVVITDGNGLKNEHFGSVMLHELGHVLGLEHSCTDKEARENFRACAGLAISHPYYQAVMYPMLSSLEIKDRLRENDILRSSCLYGKAR
jgi:hypothetical protein